MKKWHANRTTKKMNAKKKQMNKKCESKTYSRWVYSDNKWFKKYAQIHEFNLLKHRNPTDVKTHTEMRVLKAFFSDNFSGFRLVTSILLQVQQRSRGKNLYK